MYSPFGYRSCGYYDPYYYRGPGVIIMEPGGVGAAEPSGDGRVVDGSGYTRIRRNEPAPATRAGTNGDGGWGTSSTGASSSGSGSGSGTSGVSSGGYSGGGASGGSGRTAVPRPPG